MPMPPWPISLTNRKLPTCSPNTGVLSPEPSQVSTFCSVQSPAARQGWHPAAMASTNTASVFGTNSGRELEMTVSDSSDDYDVLPSGAQGGSRTLMSLRTRDFERRPNLKALAVLDGSASSASVSKRHETTLSGRLVRGSPSRTSSVPRSTDGSIIPTLIRCGPCSMMRSCCSRSLLDFLAHHSVAGAFQATDPGAA